MEGVNKGKSQSKGNLIVFRNPKDITIAEKQNERRWKRKRYSQRQKQWSDHNRTWIFH